MYDFINGKIDNIYSDSISLESNSIGYKIYVHSPYSFELKKEYKVYLYNHIRED